MQHPGLRGRTILIVENELLIAVDIRQALDDAGAFSTLTTTTRQAIILVDHGDLDGAIVDLGLSDGNSTVVCLRLKARGIPYVTYSGYEPIAADDAPHVSKPSTMYELMSALENVLAGRPAGLP